MSLHELNEDMIECVRRLRAKALAKDHEAEGARKRGHHTHATWCERRADEHRASADELERERVEKIAPKLKSVA